MATASIYLDLGIDREEGEEAFRLPQILPPANLPPAGPPTSEKDSERSS